MSLVEVRDHVQWAKHIHGNEALKQKVLAMPAETLIEIEVDGVRGMWKKMSDSKHGMPTPGLKGLGKARDHWHGLQTRRGELVPIGEAVS